MTNAPKLGLSIIVPIYNEEKTLRQVLSELISIKGDFPMEIIAINDGSTDRTKDILEEVSFLFDVKVIHVAKNVGKGAVVRLGISQLRYSHCLIFDADLEYQTSDIKKLFKPVQESLSDVVFGSRVRGVNTKQPSLLYSVGRNFLTFYMNVLFGSTITDLHTCLKLVPSEFLKSTVFKENGFGLDTEITCRMLQAKVHPLEIPITYIGRTAAEGKKITIGDGFKCLWVVTRIRFSRRSPGAPVLAPSV